MEKIYEQAKDLHVVATKIYGKNQRVYKDAACTQKLTRSELEEVFIKGVLVEVTGYGLVKPCMYGEDNGAGTIVVYVPVGDAGEDGTFSVTAVFLLSAEADEE